MSLEKISLQQKGGKQFLIINRKTFLIKRSSFSPGKKRVFFLVDKKGKDYVFILSKRDYSFFSSVYRNLSNCLLQPSFILPRVTIDGETYFYAALYPRGTTLNKGYLNNLDIENRKRIACSLVKKLQILHSYGLCHGDIKPKNVVLLNNEVLLIDCEHFFCFPYVLSFGGTKKYKLFPEDFKFYDYLEELFALFCSIFFILRGGRELLSDDTLVDINNFWQEYRNSELKMEDILDLRYRIARKVYSNVKPKIDSSLEWFFQNVIYFMKNKDYTEALKFFIEIDLCELLFKTSNSSI